MKSIMMAFVIFHALVAATMIFLAASESAGNAAYLISAVYAIGWSYFSWLFFRAVQQDEAFFD